MAGYEVGPVPLEGQGKYLLSRGRVHPRASHRYYQHVRGNSGGADTMLRATSLARSGIQCSMNYATDITVND